MIEPEFKKFQSKDEVFINCENPFEVISITGSELTNAFSNLSPDIQLHIFYIVFS